MIVTHWYGYKHIDRFVFDVHKIEQNIMHTFKNTKTGECLYIFSYQIISIEGGEN
jgi:hypothetical protein